MEGFCCFIVVGIIVAVIIMIVNSNKTPPGPTQEQIETQRTLKRIEEEKERQEKVLRDEQRIEAEKQKMFEDDISTIYANIDDFDLDVKNFFYSKDVFYRKDMRNNGTVYFFNETVYCDDSSYSSYKSQYYILLNHIEVINKALERIGSKLKTTQRKDIKSALELLKYKAQIFNEFGQYIDNAKLPAMLSEDNYGLVNQSFWSEVHNLTIEQVDIVIKNYNEWIFNLDYESLKRIDIELLLKCIWFYATYKPFDSSKFKDACSLFHTISKKDIPDTYIADIYSVNNLGANDLVHDKIKDILKYRTDVFFLIPIASGLMWMNAYREENEVLTYILKSGQQMPEKLQERLHTLSTGGGKTPSTHEVESKEEELYFDVSSLTWKNDDYEGLFNDLAFKGIKMSYSLAVRDHDEGLTVPSGCSVPTLGKMLAKFKHSFDEEYGDVVSAKSISCVAMSGDNKEHIECVLVKSDECPQMEILVHLTRVGRKLNIKLYTLFSPVFEKDTADQKQQALSLYNELSPSVKVWETSLKESILHAIQELLNQPYDVNSNYKPNGDNPIF